MCGGELHFLHSSVCDASLQTSCISAIKNYYKIGFNVFIAEECVTLTFRVEEHAKQETSMKEAASQLLIPGNSSQLFHQVMLNKLWGYLV
jgi:hypothetical protein